jgi:hypothetical protein
MNKTQKILIAVGVGVGVAYLYKRYKDKKASTSTKVAQDEPAIGENVTKNGALNREEKEEFIIDKVTTSPQENASGFEGTKFVWNPVYGRMYPVGTIVEGKEPAYVDSVFMSAEGDIVADIPKSVEVAEKSLSDLSDDEVDLLYNVLKVKDENPSITTEDDAVKELGVSNSKALTIFDLKLKKILNDIKIMKKDNSWGNKWMIRKEKRRKRRSEFKQKLGIDKSDFDRVSKRKCGRKPKRGQVAQYKKCVEGVADMMRKEVSTQVRSELSTAPVSVKAQVSNERQSDFKEQVVGRREGGMFTGKRWDGESNAYVEDLVDKGLVK